jgi:glutamate synthase (ferredoxin)
MLTYTLRVDALFPKINSSIYLKSPSVDSPHSNGPVLDDELLLDPSILAAINTHGIAEKRIKIVNTNRTVGARISGRIAKLYGNKGFQGKINLSFEGSAGQSYGAFISKGISLFLSGEANDYVGKGMNGGEIIIVPQAGYNYNAADQVIIGNTCLYGATGGYLFANGQAGERFAVRNSLAHTVVEGVGDHACEYMTGGLVVVIGKAGRNIGAGMTGGVAYFLDEGNDLSAKINHEIIAFQKVLTQEGEEQLKDLLTLHFKKTGSLKANKILQQWAQFLPMFKQLVPPSEANSPITNMAFSEFKALI